MFALIGGVLDPLPGLRIYIRQIGKASKRPKTLAHITDRAFNLTFLPSCRDVASPRNEAVFARKGEEARIEADEIPFVFGDRSGEIIEPDFASAAGHRVEGVDVTADKRFKALAMRELQIEFAAVTFDQAEGIEFTRIVVIDERTEVPPIDFETLSGARLHTHVGPPVSSFRAKRLQIVLHDRDSALEAQRAQMLGDHGGRRGSITFQ